MDGLPDELRAQVVKAHETGSHTTPVIRDWLESEGYDMTLGQLTNWFQRNQIKGPLGRPPSR